VTWRSLDSIALESGTHLKSVTIDDDADPSATNIRVRRLFPEVWLFNSTTAGLVFSLENKKTLFLFYLKKKKHKLYFNETHHERNIFMQIKMSDSLKTNSGLCFELRRWDCVCLCGMQIN
jgi:hypothetical protein